MKTLFYIMCYPFVYIKLMGMKIKSWWLCQYDWDANKSFFAPEYIDFVDEGHYLTPRRRWIIHKLYVFGKGFVWQKPYIHEKKGKIPPIVLKDCSPIKYDIEP